MDGAVEDGGGVAYMAVFDADTALNEPVVDDGKIAVLEHRVFCLLRLVRCCEMREHADNVKIAHSVDAFCGICCSGMVLLSVYADA